MSDIHKPSPAYHPRSSGMISPKGEELMGKFQDV